MAAGRGPTGYLILTEEIVTPWRSQAYSGFLAKPQMKLYIGVPPIYEGALQLETVTGDISIEHLDAVNCVALHTASGQISVSSLYTKAGFTAECNDGRLIVNNMATKGTAWLSAGAGKISGENIAVDANCTVLCLSGDCGIRNVRVAKQLTIEGSTGTFDLANLQAGSMNARITSSGMMSIRKLYAEKSVYMQTRSGRIPCSIDDNINEYTSCCQSDQRSQSAPDICGNGPKHLHAETSNGIVRVKFDGLPNTQSEAH